MIDKVFGSKSRFLPRKIGELKLLSIDLKLLGFLRQNIESFTLKPRFRQEYGRNKIPDSERVLPKRILGTLKIATFRQQHMQLFPFAIDSLGMPWRIPRLNPQRC